MLLTVLAPSVAVIVEDGVKPVAVTVEFAKNAAPSSVTTVEPAPWITPAGPEMLCYMLSHEAHHRGQICMLTHQLGHPLPNKIMAGIWNWEKLWKQCGSPTGPGDNSSMH